MAIRNRINALIAADWFQRREWRLLSWQVWCCDLGHWHVREGNYRQWRAFSHGGRLYETHGHWKG